LSDGSFLVVFYAIFGWILNRLYRAIGGCMMYGYGYHHDWMFGGLGMVLMLLLLVALLVLIVAALKYLFSAGRPRQGRTALDILDQAYARGDLQHEEYLKKRENLLKK
jgi:putative membrane protein